MGKKTKKSLAYKASFLR